MAIHGHSCFLPVQDGKILYGKICELDGVAALIKKGTITWIAHIRYIDFAVNLNLLCSLENAGVSIWRVIIGSGRERIDIVTKPLHLSHNIIKLRVELVFLAIDHHSQTFIVLISDQIRNTIDKCDLLPGICKEYSSVKTKTIGQWVSLSIHPPVEGFVAVTP